MSPRQHKHRSTASGFRIPFLIVAVLFLVILATGPAAAQSNCSEIYNGNNGWIIEKCETDPAVPTPMAIVVDGVDKGAGVLVRVYHQAEVGSGTPQVAVIYASGFVRLKPNVDSTPPMPFGSSFVLGPAYWPDNTTYHHNPELTRLEIDTSWLPDGPLWMNAAAANHDFAIEYEMALQKPRDRQTRMHVTQTFSATADILIAPDRRAEHQGLKLVQISSMYINEGGTCDGGHSDCQDSDGTRYIDADLARREVHFADLTPSSFIFDTPLPMGSNWLDGLHSDDVGWQGNTPNVRIVLDDLPADQAVTPQGWIEATTDPNDENVGLWLHGDGIWSQDWTAGQSARLDYWLVAEDDPPEPWQTLGLRSGQTFLDFEGSYDCHYVYHAAQSTTGTLAAMPGYTDTALQLDYDLGQTNGNWVQIRCNFSPPLDLSAYDHLRFDWRGSTDAANSLEVALVNPAGAGENIFGRGIHHASHRDWWGQMVVPFSHLPPWTPDTEFDPSQVSAFFISVVLDPQDDVGGAGSIAIDNLNAFNVASRAVPGALASVSGNDAAAAAAVDWLVSQQQPTGLVRSWEEEPSCVGHTYDQALALLVFLRAGKFAEADRVAAALVGSQYEDGAWPKSVDCVNLQPVHGHRWEGDIAWAIYALNRYLALDGQQAGALEARDKGVQWLASNRIGTDGCLELVDEDGIRVEAFTEPVIDAWWAFRTAGAAYADEANGIRACLMTDYWDEAMGRFKGDKTSWQVNLDNQTWGAAFLAAVNEEEKARRALSYAKETLLLPAQGGHLFGFDGQAGPWAVWNEGTGQYVAVGGPDAQDFLREPSAMQRHDGTVPGAPDYFAGAGVWTTRWHGVAPTAWLYFAHTGSPFFAEPMTTTLWLPYIFYCWPLTGPVMSADNGGDGNYAVRWSSICPGLSFAYTLEEADDSMFAQPNPIPIGPNNETIVSHQITGKVRGDYFYRVKARLQPDNQEGPWSETLAVTVDHLTIDDFEDGQDPNSIGGNMGWYGDCAIPAPNPYDPGNASGGSGYGYCLPFHVTGSCYAAWQTALLGKDFSGFETLTFKVKGADGDENPHVYLEDSSGRRENVSAKNYLPNDEHISTEYQTVSIPLFEFSRMGIDLTSLNYLQIAFEWRNMSGTIWIDDIDFR